MAGKGFGMTWLEGILSNLDVNESLSPLAFRDIPAAKAAEDAFAKYQEQYGISTLSVDYSLKNASSPLTSVDLGVISPSDLADWKFFIGLYKATGRNLPDPWVEFCEVTLNNTKTKGEAKASPLVFTYRLSCCR